MHQHKQKSTKIKLHSIPTRKFNYMLRDFSYSIPLVCSAALLLLGIFTLNPASTPTTYAEASNTPATHADSSAGGASVELSVTSPTLVKESNSNEVNYISTGLTLTTANIDSYAIYLQAADGYTGNLVGAQKGIEISGVGNQVPTTAFGDNTWGYSLAPNNIASDQLNTLTYSTVPESDAAPLQPAYTQSAPSEADSGKSFTLAFAAKFSSLTISDHYKTNVVVSVAANPERVANGWSEYSITTMEELTSGICSEADTNTTGQLKDTRDQKFYWVTKLKDGNCWMTQNLDYDGGGQKISSPGEWTTGPGNAVTKDTAAYYDPGDYYYTGSVLDWITCGDTAIGLSSCIGKGWGTNGDKHYHAGNYYSWLAITNDSGKDIESGDAASSICPGGWNLPSNAITNRLFVAYGISENEFGTITLRRSPLYFVPNGYLYQGTLHGAGMIGYYYLSTARGSSDAAGLYFYSKTASPARGATFRYYGMPARCLVYGIQPITYSITYNANSGSNAPSTQIITVPAEGYDFTIATQDGMTKSGYQFAGWAESANATTVQYKPGNKITLSAESPNKTLYAVWGHSIANIANMQDLTPAGCSASVENETKQLKDTRDNKTYWVTKLKDGNCWMTQNLDYNGGGQKINSPDDWTTGAGNAVTNETAAYYDPGNYYYTDLTRWTLCYNTVGLSACTSNGWSTSGDAHYHAGNYYSWEAAMAACPSGWQLAGNYGYNGGLGHLLSGLSTTMMRQSPYYMIPSGRIDSKYLDDAGEEGYYWSSDTNVSGRASFSKLASDQNGLGVGSSPRYIGYSVRCNVLGS